MICIGYVLGSMIRTTGFMFTAMNMDTMFSSVQQLTSNLIAGMEFMTIADNTVPFQGSVGVIGYGSLRLVGTQGAQSLGWTRSTGV